MSNWWDADKIETPGGTEFWKADEVVSETPQEEQEVVTSARGSEARADVEQEVISDRANNWRNRSIFKDKPTAGAGRGSADDPRRLDRAQESEWAKEVRSNLPTIDGNLQISAPEPKKPREYKSVLEGIRMTGGGFDEREAQRLSRRDYAEQAEREAEFAARGSQRMTEARQPILRDRQRFAEENPITAGFAQSAANTLVGTLNAPAVVAGLVNESLVQPVSRAVVGAAGGDERLLPGRVPNMPLVDDLRSIGSEYASQLSRKTPGQAWDDGDFGRWLMTQMSANSFSAAQSLGALFVPGAQATLLSSMGAVSAGNAYAEGDSAKASALKGLVEAGSEMLPLKAAEKIKDLVLTIPEPMRQKALADAGKRLLAAGTAVTTNSLVGALEETVAQVGGNAIDIGISGKNKSLFDEVDRAAIVGGAFGGGMSAPAVIEAATGPTSPEQRRALELARALNGGEFTTEGIDSAVANALRTEPGSSNLIDPAATTIGAPAMQVAVAERARVDDMIAKRDEIKTQVEAVKTEAVADIGRQDTVDGAIAATTRAVNLDSNALLDGALKAAGIDPNELQAIDKQAQAAINTVAEPTAADAATQTVAPVADAQAVPVTPQAQQDSKPLEFEGIKTSAPQPQQSTVVWTGRRGDGYATPDDANRALNERQRLRPAYDWSVRQNPEGRYVLEGALRTRDGAQAGVSAAGNTQVAPMGQNAPDAIMGGADVSVRGRALLGGLRQQPADPGVDVEAAAAVQELAVAAGDPGGFHAVSRESALRWLSTGERARSRREAAGLPATQSTADPAEILSDIENFAEAAEGAFGRRPVLMSGPRSVFGVQHRGRTFVNIAAIANGDAKGNPVQAIALQTIGHETTHDLEKSANPQDRADHALLRQAVLGNAKPGVVDSRVQREAKDLKRLAGETDAQFAVRAQRYGENEVVADVSGNFWTDPQFWGRLYDLDKAAMRRIVYKFMEKATRLLRVVKGSRLDNEVFIRNIEQVREVAAQVWASKAKRGDSLFASQDQTVSKSQADRLPGVNAEVAPDPRNKEAAEKWGRLTEVDKLGITKEVMDRVATKVFDNMGLQGWSVDYTSGMFEGGINPSAILRAPDGTSTELLGEVMRVLGYVLDQKGMVAFDESNTTSESQAGFVKVVLPEGLSTDKIDLIRKEIAARVPQAEGDTVRDGAIVYGNFSAYNDSIETLTDQQFYDVIADVVDTMPEEITVAGPFVFHSEYDQAYWDDAYDPKGREAYLEKTRYASNAQEALPGRDGVRRGLGGNLSRAWLDNLARDTDTRISRLVGDKQPRKAYGTTPDARASGAGVAKPAKPSGLYDGSGRSDALRSGGNGVVVAENVQRDGQPPRYGRAIEGATSAIGYHFSKAARTSLNGSFYGKGLNGAEAKRLNAPENADIRPRVFFYVDAGRGVRPEFGVGPYPHSVQLDNLYDVTADALGIVKSVRGMADKASALERAVMEAGFDGYIRRNPIDPQHYAVLVGKKHSDVPVVAANPRRADGQQNLQPATAKPNANATRRDGDMLVRKPEGQEVMEVIRAKQAGINEAAPSFEMAYGEARVLASEVQAADAVFESLGGTFRFGEAAYSRADADVTETANFKRWFGDSKVVDAEGKPLVVYHGTQGYGIILQDRRATFFTSSPEVASSYAGDDGLVQPIYLRLSNPLEVDAMGATSMSLPFDGMRVGMPYLIKEARRLKRDGVIVRNVEDMVSGVVGDYFIAIGKSQIKSAIGNNGNFDPADPRISYSKDDFNELGAFNLDISDDLENESLSFLDDKKTLKAVIQQELEAERRMAEKARAAAVAAAPTQDEIKKAGYAPEKAFDLTGSLVYDEDAGKFTYTIPEFAKGIIRAVRARTSEFGPSVTVEQSMHTAFMNKAPSPEIAERFINRQVAGAYLQSTGFDLADTYRKGTIQKIASTWKAISKHSGFFKLPARSGNLDFESVAKEMGAMKGYDITAEDLGYLTIVTMRKDGKAPFKAEYSFRGSEIECCTMGLAGSGGLGTEFYAVLSQIAENTGKRFVPDATLSGVNTYRRIEQAMSYALKSGRTDVMLPGPLNRVYGYNYNPATQQDHDTNIARLAIAGMRNAEELFPEVRRLSYDPATDSFTDSRGQDAEAQVTAALEDPEARAMGLGRSTLARAVLTSDIISGKLTAADVTEFEKPVAYSMADVGMDEPMAESWGDDRDGVNSLTPQLRRFIAGSKIVNNEGLPIVMYHGTGRDIQAFRAKQAGAIFVTYNPKFADDFAALSVDWMRANWREVLTPEQIESAKQQAAAAIMADKSIKMSERKAMKQAIMDGTPTGAAANAMPSGENIIPVFVRATAPFDFRVPSMVQDVIYTLQDRQGVESGGEVEIQLVKEGGQRMKVSEDDLEMALRSGMWEFIESPEIQAVIRDDLAHDGFFVKETGQVNLAVYEPSQLKSVFNRGTYDLGDDRLSYSRAAGPKESKYQDNYLVPEVEGAFADNSGNIAVMPALVFAKDGIRREYKAMPVRMRVGDHQYGTELKKQYGLQHRIGNKAKDASRGYITPELEGDNASALEVERAARDITLGILDAQTAYADSAPTKIYLHSPSLNRATVLERQTDSKGQPFWSVVTSMPSTREQMMRRYKAPTSIFGLTLNGDRSQQSVETQRGILKKLREPGRPQLSAESYILDEDGLLYHQTPAVKSTNTVDTPKVVKQLQRDANGKIVLNKRKAADQGVSMSRADIEDSANFKRWFKDSKVVDADGRPLVVYHATTSDIKKFSIKKSTGGFYFTPEARDAYPSQRGSMTSERGLNVMPCYLSIVNPLRTSNPAEWHRLDSKRRSEIEARGFDGVVVENADGSVREFIAFRPEQIKSAIGNNGNFNPADPRISYSQAAGYDIPAESFIYKARRKMQDYFIRARLVQEAIASQGGVVDETTDFYRAEELSHGRIGSLLQDFADQQVRPLMEKAVEFGIELDELSLYAYAMHAKERNAYIATIDPKMQDGGSGMTNDEADSILDLVKLSGDQAKFEELHSDLMAITRGNRLAMLADGLITQDEFDKLEGAYDYYIPLRGFELMDEDGKPTGRSPGKGFNIRGPETLKAKGRRSRAGQLVENVINDYQRTVVRGERNHVAKVFLNFVLSNPDDALWEIDATTTRKSLDRQTGRIARNTVIEKGEDTISVKIQGREIYIKIKDDLLLRAMRKTYTDETGEMANDLMRSVGLYSSLLRNTLTRYNPEFAVVNAMRDFGFGATAALDALGEKGAAKFVAHYAGAMAVSARNESKKLDASREWDKWFLEYKAAGGTTSGFYAKGLEEISGDIRDMMIEAGAQPKDFTEKMRFNKATRAAKAALRVLEYAGSVSENAARVAAYRTAREMGKTPSQAASIAKNLTTNFDRKGEYGQILNALYLFYNAGIQGTQKTLQMFRNPKIMGYMAGVTAASVGLALASATAGGDDPDDGMAYWDKIPAHVKERNIIIMLPPGSQVEGAEEVGTKGRYLTIPVQYGLNIFHVLGYQIADVIRNRQDKTRGVDIIKGGINMASAVAGSFNPFGGAVDLTNESSRIQAILPTVFDFPYQLVSGTNAFGRDVAPFKSPFDSKPDSQNSNVRQAGAPSEKVAQWLNSVTGGSAYEPGVIDISAGTVENLVRNLTGGTGMFIYDVLALTGKGVDAYTGGDPDLFVRDIPVVRRVLGETAGDVDQGLFYERRKAIQEARAIQKGAEEADAEITNPETLALASMNKDASKYTRWLSEIRKEMAEIKRDPELSDVERQTRIRELRAQRDSLTAEFNRNFMEVMREEFNSSAAR